MEEVLGWRGADQSSHPPPKAVPPLLGVSMCSHANVCKCVSDTAGVNCARAARDGRKHTSCNPYSD